jgi:hypothetical protein
MHSDHHTAMISVISHLRVGRKIDAIKLYRAMNMVGLKEAKEACEAISGALPKPPKADPMAGRVEIRDSKNTDRVLGSVPRPSGASPRLDGGDGYNMAIMGRLSISAMPYDPCEDMARVSHVRFGFRCINWNVVLVTDASLELISQIKDFRFPGEDEEQAHVRQMYAR